MSDRPDDGEQRDERPIEVLDDLELETDERFVRNVRNKIDRRLTSNQLLSLGWEIPRLVVMEFVVMVLEIVLPADRRGKDRR